MERVLQEEFDDGASGANLGAETAQGGLVGVGQGADHQLIAEILGHALFEAGSGQVVEVVAIGRET